MKIICPSCHYVGESKAIAKGSRKVEVTLGAASFYPGCCTACGDNRKRGNTTGVHSATKRTFG